MSAADELRDDILACYDDPYKFVLMAFDWGQADLTGWDGPDEWQTAFLKRTRDAIRNRKPGEVIKIAVKTGRGVGKTALEAWLILWLMSTRPDFAGFAIANTGEQLDDKLWRELSLWHSRAINADWFVWTAKRFMHVDRPQTWGIDALKWKEQNPDALGGLHNGGRGQCAIVDEGSGVPGPIYDVIEATMTDPDSFVFVFGNPLRKTGRFYDLFSRFAHRWIPFTVDSRTSRVANQSTIQQSIEDYGLDSDYVRVSVLGDFPRTDAQTLISLELIEAASRRKAEGCDHYRPVWGVDVARFGDDRTCVVKRRHRRYEGKEVWRNVDLMQTAGRIKAMWDEALPPDRPCAIVVDVIGIGGGVVDRLREMDGIKDVVRALNVSESPAVKTKFSKLRDEMFWKGREWFETMAVECTDAEVGGELADVLYSYTSNGQIKIEPKADIKERLGRSPDVGEAFLLSLMAESVVAERAQDRYARARSRTGEMSAWAN